MNEWKEKKEVFEQSYQEVLSALKHQDDKLNRTLTALAFLTVAGVALLPEVTGRNGGAPLGGSGPDASTVFFVAFLIAVAIGVIVTLTAIGPGSPLRRRSSPEERSKRKRSLIFYARISTDPDWDGRLAESPEELFEGLADNYHRETLQIAHRVNYKVTRSREAVVWVQLAIVTLALMGIFGAAELAPTTRWWIASGLLVVVLAIPLWDLWLMRDTKYIDSGYSPVGYAMLLTVVAFATAFLVAGTSTLADAQWEALAFSAVGFIVPRYALVRPAYTHALLAVGLLAALPVLLMMVF